jgi:proteasome lid subunit RPN8/RPN11
LLGTIDGASRTIRDYLPYDEVDPNCLQGSIVFDGSRMDLVWDECARRGFKIVADVHTHPGGYQQSSIDRAHPMMPKRGHLALILPDFAARTFKPGEIGIFELRGVKDWLDRSARGETFFKLRWP